MKKNPLAVVETDTMRQFLQKQPYSLTMARHALGIHQMRIMIRLVEQLQPFMSVDREKCEKVHSTDVWVKVSELVVGNNFNPLCKALEGMMRKIVRIYRHVTNDDITSRTIEIGIPSY